MPNIKSAKKRVLVINKKHEENRIIKSQLKTALKKFNAAVDANDIALAEQLLPATVSEIDSACTKGIIHKNNAANKKAKIANKLNKAKANA